jgi:hypothetical protein
MNMHVVSLLSTLHNKVSKVTITDKKIIETTNFGETGFGGVDCIHLAKDRDQ